MNEKLLMSVGIMTFEGAKRIPYELKSLEESTTERNFRIVVHDDGSSEANQEELKRIVKKFDDIYGNVDLILSKENHGTRYSTNRCMEFHDSIYGSVWADDLLAVKDWLRTWVLNYKNFSEFCEVGFLGFDFKEFQIQNKDDDLGRADLSTAPCGFLVLMEKDKFWKIGGLDERAHSFAEEIEIGMKCIDKKWNCIMLPYPKIPHIGSVTWSHGGPKTIEKERRYNESSELLQNEYWGRDWSLHRNWEKFVLTNQPANRAPFGVQIIEREEKDSCGNTIRRWKEHIKTPLLLFENALIPGVLIPNYYEDILNNYISGKKKWSSFNEDEAYKCLNKND